MNLPFYNPGYLPPLNPPPYSYTPPFVGPMPTVTTDPSLTPTPQQGMNPASNGMYQTGPFCFGLDKFICANLPATIHLGGAPSSMMERIVPGIDIPVQRFCYALTNTLCAVLVLILLLSLVGIGVYGLLQ